MHRSWCAEERFRYAKKMRNGDNENREYRQTLLQGALGDPRHGGGVRNRGGEQVFMAGEPAPRKAEVQSGLDG